VISQDMPGLLKSMSEAFSTQGMNIHNAQVRTTRDSKAVATFDVSVRNTQQLNQVIFDLQKIKGVIGVSRLTDS
jgi:GTP pyrophosphokinase